MVDAGISGKRVQQALTQLQLPPADGIFVTHEHSDHVSGVGVLARRFKLPVYAAPLTWRYFLRHKTLGSIPEAQVKIIEPAKPLCLNGVTVTAFDVPHDASQPVGYSFCADGIKVTVATDIGHVTDSLREHLRGSHILLMECNHDTDMLKNGRYHYLLKERVLSPRGHLSNAHAGALLAEVAHDKLEYAFLGHLSEENNLPLLAMDTVQRILKANRVRLPFVAVADRHGPSELVEL